MSNTRRLTGSPPAGDGRGRSAGVRAGRAILAALLLLVTASATAAQERLRVMTTLPTYAAIAREVAGEAATVEAVARGDQDPHFVNPRPSFAAKLQKADLFVTTGLDLELWVPALLDRARNRRVVEGADGHVVAYDGIQLLQVPENVSRAGGDVHVFGNPHVHTDPVNGILIARNIAAGLERADPSRAAGYRERLQDFERRVMERTFGERLVELVGQATLLQLARDHRFWAFAEEQTYRGRPLTAYLGGWLERAAPFRGERMVCYHKNWAYFSARFRIECAEYVEPKPGIPPSPGHVQEVIRFMEEEGIRVLFAANYFSRGKVERVASRTGSTAVIVPEHVAGAEGVETYFDLFDHWISKLRSAFGAEAAAGSSRGPRQRGR